jgi:hypothetical protein
LPALQLPLLSPALQLLLLLPALQLPLLLPALQLPLLLPALQLPLLLHARLFPLHRPCSVPKQKMQKMRAHQNATTANAAKRSLVLLRGLACLWQPRLSGGCRNSQETARWTLWQLSATGVWRGNSSDGSVVPRLSKTATKQAWGGGAAH